MTDHADARAPVKLECFFDCSSPWTYLGFHNLQTLAARLGVPVHWRPILVGGVFNKVNTPVYENRANAVPLKAAYMHKDLADWAQLSGVTINSPPKCGHPVNAVKSMRACVAVQPLGKLEVFARSAFEALWHEGLDLALDETLAGLCLRTDLDPEWLLAQIATPEVKAALWENTNELMERGGFGSPTFFVEGQDMFFGNDRLLLVEAALRRAMGLATLSYPARELV